MLQKMHMLATFWWIAFSSVQFLLFLSANEAVVLNFKISLFAKKWKFLFIFSPLLHLMSLK